MRDGVLKAVVVGDVSLDSVVANIKSIHPTPSSFGMLIDNGGRVIAHPDRKLTFKPVADIAPDFDKVTDAPFALANPPAEVTVNDKRKLIRAQSVPGTDWHVVIALDKSEATAGMRSLLTASLLSLTVVIASLIVGAITTTAFRRLRQVCHAMAAVASLWTTSKCNVGGTSWSAGAGCREYNLTRLRPHGEWAPDTFLFRHHSFISSYPRRKQNDLLWHAHKKRQRH
ncbi:hypothetical protein BN2475_700005 [Paraburkholderia ribeironis]|uniref:Cache domain-containing protein n=1 Tax=Paraburkholderia ribeironis TaxID=1247936 RepID=A0A1N7SHE7_9BURK|nr:hypothetical protein BN2475_700005 [Paraburkholderia ribeironis]